MKERQSARESSVSSRNRAYRSMLISRGWEKPERMFVLCFLLANVIRVNALNDEKNQIRLVNNHVIESYEKIPPTERSIFNYQKAGVRVDVKIVPVLEQNFTEEVKIVEKFPEFPTKDIGRCVLDLSLSCIKKRFAKLLETIGYLNEITLIGQNVKLVKTRKSRDDRRSFDINDASGDEIRRSIDDFFDMFVLRITFPTWNGKREKNQIDLMFDEGGPVVEGSFQDN